MPEPRPTRPYIVELKTKPDQPPIVRLVLAKTDRGAKGFVIASSVTCRPASAVEAYRLGCAGVALETASEAGDDDDDTGAPGDGGEQPGELAQHDPAGGAPGTP